ncbi:hypothetical protein LOC68_22800 [Blastopirellula sp. JC732]|uniref:Outer membrane lipoprotein-sorting protein n=1 Tax=Blastopirellula sediminis TaxID=2894196 RepID=A0A9X1MRN8_9BACT|nr:hypothetical protein [Blastopirellula sediminis]MCC9605468.1 hypothetical protein [Blastopirellula sediminis]MCC9631232.1 hypothetical protein [Blastopirellula sediminis]
MAAGVLLAVLTALCAFDLSSLPYFASSAQAQNVDVASNDDSAAVAAEEVVSGEAVPLVADALRRILSYSSIEARMEYATKTPVTNGAGRYWEQGPLLRRMELKLRGVEDSLLLQVNDGKTLWTRCETPRETVTDSIRYQLPLRSPQLYLGKLGLAGLLTRLQEDYDLAVVGSGNLAGEQVIVVKGALNKDALTRMLPKREEEIRSGEFSTWSELRTGVPVSMLIAFGATDAVPRRIQYRAVRDGATLRDWRQWETQETLTIDLREVLLNRPIAPTVFTHSEGW